MAGEDLSATLYQYMAAAQVDNRLISWVSEPYRTILLFWALSPGYSSQRGGAVKAKKGVKWFHSQPLDRYDKDRPFWPNYRWSSRDITIHWYKNLHIGEKWRTVILLIFFKQKNIWICGKWSWDEAQMRITRADVSLRMRVCRGRDQYMKKSHFTDPTESTC